MAAREWRSACRTDRHGGLDRADPIQRDPQLRSACPGERGGVSGAAWRDHADTSGAMDALVHRITGWDGPPLVAREWYDGTSRTPLLCLPGIVRTSGDFETLARNIGQGRRVVSPDYPGRGE